MTVVKGFLRQNWVSKNTKTKTLLQQGKKCWSLGWLVGLTFMNYYLLLYCLCISDMSYHVILTWTAVTLLTMAEGLPVNDGFGQFFMAPSKLSQVFPMEPYPNYFSQIVDMFIEYSFIVRLIRLYHYISNHKNNSVYQFKLN